MSGGTRDAETGGAAPGAAGRPVARDRLVAYLDAHLDVAGWPDKSLNGLQVEGAAEVTRVALATDAALATIGMAADARAQLLLVHHGLFWGEVLPVRGPHRARIAALLEAGISLYAAHLPLDGHPEHGNNAVLARLLDLTGTRPFGRHADRHLGVLGKLPEPAEPPVLAARLEALLQTRPVVLAFGPDAIERVAVVSGDAAALIPEAAAAGADAFVTGETSHVAWHAAREHRIHVFFAGHYATETLGVCALGDHLAQRFGIEAVFLDAPTGF